MPDDPFGDIPYTPNPLRQHVETNETGGRNLPPTANHDYPHSHASGLAQFQPQTWQETARATGIGAEAKEAYQATADEQRANENYLLKKFGPNASYTWAASAPRGGYRDSMTEKDPFADIPVAKGQKSSGDPFADIPAVKPGPGRAPSGPAPSMEGANDQLRRDLNLPSIGQVRSEGMDPSIAARIKQLPPQTVAAMMRDPKNPMWIRVMGGVAGAAADMVPDLPGLAKRAGAETAANTATPETASAVGGLAFGAMIKSPAIKTAEGAVVEGANHPAIRDAGTDGQPGFTTTPPVDHVRLYRLEPKSEKVGRPKGDDSWVFQTPEGQATLDATGRWFGEKEETAQWYQQHLKDNGIESKMTVVDLPKAEAEKYRVANLHPNDPARGFSRRPDEEFFLPRELADRRTEGGFVSRKEGAKIAVAARQTPPEVTNLHSEDLYPGSSRAIAPVGADVPAQRPVHEIALENMKRFAEENKSPGFMDQLKGFAKEARTYFDTRDAAKAIIQRTKGEANQMAYQATAAMEKFRAFTSTLSTEEQVSAIELLESGDVRKGYFEGLPKESQAFLSTFREWMMKYQHKLETLPQSENMKFKEDFVTHLYQQPKNMANFIHEYGAKTGSNYFTKKRTFESFADGVRAGLPPLTTNPVELFARYVENASAKIGSWEALDDAKEAGYVLYRKPGGQPDGWQPLANQRDAFGHEAYAPKGFASVWNTYYNRPQPTMMRNAFDYIHTGANQLTAFRLGFSAVHSGLVSFDAIASGVGNAITKAMWGSPLKGMLELVKSPAKPFTAYSNAKEAFRTYLDASYGTPAMKKIMQGLVDANFDFRHEGKAADEFRASKIPGFLKLIERGNLKQTLGNEMGDIGKIRSVIRNGVRLATITGEAQFQYYVPWVKTQTAMDLMKTYLDAHPEVTREDLATYARRVSDRVDARFGEMNKDNIFWSQTAKKLAAISFLSYSFTYGSLRQVASGAGGVGGLPLRIGMKMAGTLHPTRPVWDDAASYVIGVAITYAAINAMYEYLKTGTAPQSGEDLLHPRTGGEVMAAGKKVPERASATNVANSFLNLLASPGDEFYNKLSPLVHMIKELAENHDWQGLPIRNKLEPWQRQAQDVASYIFSDAMQPIQYGQFEGRKKGTNISVPENLVGVRASGSGITNPQGVGKAIDYNLASEMYDKYRREENARRAQDGRSPVIVPPRLKKIDIQHIIQDPSYNPFAKAPAYGGMQ